MNNLWLSFICAAKMYSAVYSCKQLNTFSLFCNILRFNSRRVIITTLYSYDNEAWWMEMSHVEDKEPQLPGPFAVPLPACPACLFTNQSITFCFVINQSSSAPFPSPPFMRAEEQKNRGLVKH